MIPFASFMTARISNRAAVSRKSEVWADNLGNRDGNTSLKELKRPLQWVLMTTAHGLKAWRCRVSGELGTHVELTS